MYTPHLLRTGKSLGVVPNSLGILLIQRYYRIRITIIYSLFPSIATQLLRM